MWTLKSGKPGGPDEEDLTMSSTAESMKGTREAGRIVVGVDGSPGSLHALSWAGREARLRDATLEVVVAWTYPIPVLLFPVAPDPPDVKTLRKEAHELVERALAKVADDVSGIDVERRVVEGSAPEVLMNKAKEADLLVLGSRGLGGFRGLLLGSVSQQCALHATCPVVVVPSPDES
jgi:nucleotide-binding universal stress UspA family protein